MNSLPEDPQKTSLGYHDFAELRQRGAPYVDKTGFIPILMEKDFKTLLITRPRRFGKSLLLSTLNNFLDCNYLDDPEFEQRLDRRFAGLKISDDKAFCAAHRAQYAVIMLTFSGIKEQSFSDCLKRFASLMYGLYKEYEFLLNRPELTSDDRENFDQCLKLNKQNYFDESQLSSLILDAVPQLAQLLRRVYGRKVLVLIDEYDVPLQNAYTLNSQEFLKGTPGALALDLPQSFYQQMARFIRLLFEPIVKPPATGRTAPDETASAIYRTIMTGCLRVSQESIFTGANNLKVRGVGDDELRDICGFTAEETSKLLCDVYKLKTHEDTVRDWYDGYRFGLDDVKAIYCPWDVISYCDDQKNRTTKAPAAPRCYWKNTSGNEIIYDCLTRLDEDLSNDFQTLLDGGTVYARIDNHFTFRELWGEISGSQLFTLLYFSGYLTVYKEPSKTPENIPEKTKAPADKSADTADTAEKDALVSSDEHNGQAARVNKDPALRCDETPHQALVADKAETAGDDAAAPTTGGAQAEAGEQVKNNAGKIPLCLPNREIKQLFAEQIEEFLVSSRHDPAKRQMAKQLYEALLEGRRGTAEACLNKFFMSCLSVESVGYEPVYHAFIVGLLQSVAPLGATVKLEPESGNGYIDVRVMDPDNSRGAILEFKRLKETSEKTDKDERKSLLKAATAALSQIKSQAYDQGDELASLKSLKCFGIGCRGKKCALICEDAVR